jgi:hypothetical protein
METMVGPCDLEDCLELISHSAISKVGKFFMFLVYKSFKNKSLVSVKFCAQNLWKRKESTCFIAIK